MKIMYCDISPRSRGFQRIHYLNNLTGALNRMSTKLSKLSDLDINKMSWISNSPRFRDNVLQTWWWTLYVCCAVCAGRIVIEPVSCWANDVRTLQKWMVQWLRRLWTLDQYQTIILMSKWLAPCTSVTSEKWWEPCFLWLYTCNTDNSISCRKCIVDYVDLRPDNKKL